MANSLNGIGDQRSSGPTTIPGRARTVSTNDGRGGTPAQRDAAASRTPAERSFVNLDGRRFDMSAPRGTYVNILV